MREAGLRRGGYLRQRRAALGGSDCIGFESAAVDRLHDVGGDVAHVIDLAGDQRSDGGRGAVERDQRRLDAEYGIEQQAGEMRDRADAGMRHVQGLGVRPRIACEFLQVLGGKVLFSDDHHRKPGDHADRREIDFRVVGEAGIERDGRRVRSHIAQFKRVAIGVGTHRPYGAGGAAGPDGILDDELLPERARHVLAENPGNDIGRPAGGERHDDGDGPRRIGLRRRCLPARHCEGKYRDGQNEPTSRRHEILPPSRDRPRSAAGEAARGVPG